MHFIPYQSNTLVSPCTGAEIQARLEHVTQPLQDPRSYSMTAELTYLKKRPENHRLFRGWIKNNRFCLIQNVHHPEHFLPLILGRIETTSQGCILFIRYQIPRGTLFIAILATVLLFSTACVFLFLQKNVGSFLLTVFFWGFSYGVMLLNFRQKVKIGQQIFESVLREIS